MTNTAQILNCQICGKTEKIYNFFTCQHCKKLTCSGCLKYNTKGNVFICGDCPVDYLRSLDEKQLIYEEANKNLFDLANKGDVDAQEKLGFMYMIGDNMVKDPVKSFKWYKLAADSGCTNAQFAIGDFYRKGMGVDKDLDMAFKYYTLCIDHPLARIQLAEIYLKGTLCVKRNIFKAIRLLKSVSDHGDAMDCLQSVYKNAMNQLQTIYRDHQNEIINRLLELEDKQIELTTINEEQSAYITELEYMPHGVKSQEAQVHFEEIAKISL